MTTRVQIDGKMLHKILVRFRKLNSMRIIDKPSKMFPMLVRRLNGTTQHVITNSHFLASFLEQEDMSMENDASDTGHIWICPDVAKEVCDANKGTLTLLNDSDDPMEEEGWMLQGRHALPSGHYYHKANLISFMENEVLKLYKGSERMSLKDLNKVSSFKKDTYKRIEMDFLVTFGEHWYQKPYIDLVKQFKLVTTGRQNCFPEWAFLSRDNELAVFGTGDFTDNPLLECRMACCLYPIRNKNEDA